MNKKKPTLAKTPAVGPTSDDKAKDVSTTSVMAKLLAEAEPLKLQAGEVVEATVITKSKSELWVDVGGLSTGFIPAREVAESGKVIHDIALGDKVVASVILPENDEGYAILSMKRAARDRVWVDLAAKFELKESFSARVTEANSGGLLIDVAGVQGFLPVSQLAPEHYPRVAGGDRDLIFDRLNKLVSTDLTVQVLDCNQAENKLILSEKLARQQETEVSLSKYAIGDVVKGKITGVVDFGAFVSFEGLEGLIHISEIDWNRVNDPREHLRVGQDVEAKIISIAGSKVSLSLKRLKDDPWAKAAEKYKEGTKVKGDVTRVTPFGAFVELADDISGLVHVSELSEEHVANPLDVMKVGEQREFLILSIDPDAHRIALSIKALANPVKATRAAKKAAPAKSLEKLSAGVLKKLSEAGYGDMAKVKAASEEELTALPGIGQATAKKIKAALG